MEYYTEDNYHPPTSPKLLAINLARDGSVWDDYERGIDISAPWNTPLRTIRPRRRPRVAGSELEYMTLASQDEDPSETYNDQAKKRGAKRQRTRCALPIIIGRDADTVEVMSCADSGSDESIISLEFSKLAGLKIQKPKNEPKRFSIANGRIVEAIGEVHAKCSFAAGSSARASIFDCVFHVFSSLAVPVIVGMDFLQQTETLSKHRDRLVEELVPATRALRVNSVGRPRQNLLCRLDSYVGCAITDTGSDLDLVSPEFARSRAFNIEPAHEELEFADCSIGHTSGIIKASFSVGDFSDLEGFLPRGEAIDLEFYLLDDLHADILLGQGTIEELNIFGLHAESFIPSISRLGESDVSIIRHIGRLERFVSKSWNKLNNGVPTETSKNSPDPNIDFEAKLSLHDQSENARREAARSEIETLTGPAKLEAQEKEAMRIREFEEERAQLLRCQSELTTTMTRLGSASDNDTSYLPSSEGDAGSAVVRTNRSHRRLASDSAGSYIFPIVGSSAPGFQTQYLLNFHANVHAPSYPRLFCPVDSCTGPQGGRGFNCTKEMIQYLVHGDLTLGFVCPFCTDREHTYPRLDQLQRHVRVFHKDKDKDDPVLQLVLSQQPDGLCLGMREVLAVKLRAASQETAGENPVPWHWNT
ncbi:hypothetical protein CONLIGDRAFT_629660 [Coniochaeta ligniaria NRRL 30616]|uniref:C2H2-type domain-containing protein n=1 Tax=Coniochaeta ligniaria NRRL 30616 TaxID=1408157 RepID=A0A1J7JW20_9PEZI|nr:hypothetical protein CONLIGDRAFT_629660 [Coniochaeta ligniaria NRRL 30616]